MQLLQRSQTHSRRALMSHRSPQLPWLGGEANFYNCGALQWPTWLHCGILYSQAGCRHCFLHGAGEL